jgi:predicted DNA-binding ribbon-helix-helix protein
LTGNTLNKSNNLENKIKSGKDVIDDFFAEIYNIPNADKNTVDALVELYSQGKLSDKNVQNTLDVIVQNELKQIEKEDE